MAGQVVMWRQNGIKHYGRHAKRKRWMRLLFQCFWVGCEELQMAASEPDFPDAAKDDLLPCNLRIWSRWLLRDCSWLEFTINAYHFANAKTNSTGLLTYRDDVVFSFIQIVLKIKVYFLTKKFHQRKWDGPDEKKEGRWKQKREVKAGLRPRRASRSFRLGGRAPIITTLSQRRLPVRRLPSWRAIRTLSHSPSILSSIILRILHLVVASVSLVTVSSLRLKWSRWLAEIWKENNYCIFLSVNQSKRKETLKREKNGRDRQRYHLVSQL